MSTVSSFIVRIYSRRSRTGIGGTVEAVPHPTAPGATVPQPFANDTELLGLLRGGSQTAKARKRRLPVRDVGAVRG